MKKEIKRGQFITFEGGEGGGKSTQLKRVAEYLTAQNIDFIVTREPGGSNFAEKVRGLILSAGKDEIDPLTEYLLFSAARHNHIRTVIEPALAAGKWVLSDRFYDSSAVYQGFAPGDQALDADFMETIYKEARKGSQEPDLTLIFDIDPKVGLTRAKKVSQGSDHFEDKNLAFHQSVREGFLQQFKKNPKRCHLIDASKDLQQITDEVVKVIQTRFE